MSERRHRKAITPKPLGLCICNLWDYMRNYYNPVVSVYIHHLERFPFVFGSYRSGFYGIRACDRYLKLSQVLVNLSDVFTSLRLPFYDSIILPTLDKNMEVLLDPLDISYRFTMLGRHLKKWGLTK
jgi:hypothetical protein